MKKKPVVAVIGGRKTGKLLLMEAEKAGRLLADLPSGYSRRNIRKKRISTSMSR